jgi:hypothetical protein
MVELHTVDLQLNTREFRTLAERQLGGGFDVRDFRDVVLEKGAASLWRRLGGVVEDG